MPIFKIVAIHNNGFGKEVKHKKSIPLFLQKFVNAEKEEKVKEWLKEGNRKDLLDFAYCPWGCCFAGHEFNIKEIKPKDVPKGSNIIKIKREKESAPK